MLDEYELMKYKLTSDALGIGLWDMDVVDGDPVNPDNKFTWSPEFRQMLGFTDENDFPNVLHSWSDLLLPEDKERTLTAFEAHIRDHTGKTPYDIEYRLFLKNGESRYFRAFGTTQRDEKGKPIRVAGALLDIDEQTKTRELLVHREKMLDTLNKTAILFLSQSKESFENMMTAGVMHIADVLGLDRITVWRNSTKSDGLHATQFFCWDKSSDVAQVEIKEAEDITYAAFGPRWEKLLADGESVNSPVRLLPEATVLEPFGVVSVFAAPVFIDMAFWGFVLFEDCHTERYFNEDSADIMRSAAFLCTNTIIIHEKTLSERKTTEALKCREKMLRAINEMADMLISHDRDEFGEVMSKGLKSVSSAVGVDRIAVYRLLDGKSKLGQIYLWKGKTLPLEDKMRVLPDIPPITRWLSVLMKDETINGNINDMAKDEVEFLSQFGIKSIFMVPIFTNEKFWGVITLEDHTNYRYFDEDSLEMLQSAAHICAGAVVRAELDREIRRLEIEADKIYVDALTGINNRRFFDENLNPIIKTLSRSDAWLSLMMIDVDCFKVYNDTYGHNEGDKCLRTVAETIAKSITRAEDFAARYGGEEFVIVLPHTNENGACLLAEKLINSVRKCKIPHPENPAADHVTISVGVTTSRALHMQNGEEYIKRADEMLYLSKQNGRNRYTFGSL